jgi:hypothetical protein
MGPHNSNGMHERRAMSGWNRLTNGQRDELVKQQNADGSWQGDFAGHVYGTAIALLTLQLPYQYLPIFQRLGADEGAAKGAQRATE